MAKNSVADWSATAADNTDIGGTNIGEGCSPSGINNAIREMMAQVKALNPVGYASLSPTAEEQGQARANIGADLLGGFRNKVINGDFIINARSAGLITTNGSYFCDRWLLFTGSSSAQVLTSSSVWDLTSGATANFARIINTHASSSGGRYIHQKVEGVRTLAGRTVTLTFWARLGSGQPTQNLVAIIIQDFGTGGSPSSQVTITGSATGATTSWQKFSTTLDLPAISGTLGSDGNDCLIIRLGASLAASAMVDIAHVSLVEGDATAEDDPFSSRHIQQEVALCKRYYEAVVIPSSGLASVGQAYSATNYFWDLPFAEKRATPSISVPTTLTPLLDTGSSGVSVSQTPSAVYYNRCRVTGVTSSTLVAGNATAVYANGASTITIDAEL